MKTYLLTYHSALPMNVFSALETAGVDEWLQAWQGMVLFKGTESQEYYARKIREENKVSMFMVAEYDPRQTYGWMPEKVWEWVKPEARPTQAPVAPAQLESVASR